MTEDSAFDVIVDKPECAPRREIQTSTTRTRRQNGKAAAEAAGQLVLPFKFVLARDIKFEPKEYVVEDIAGLGETSGWYGPPDAGKSTVAVDVAAHVAADLFYCGKKVRRGAVLYLATERAAVTKRRIRAWMQHRSISDLPLAVVDAGIDLRTGEIDARRIIATAKELEQLTGFPVVLIIIDTLNRVLFGGDENSRKDAGAFIAQVATIQRDTEAHIAILHHVPVDRTDRMRGHGSIEGALDVTVAVIKDAKNIVTVQVDKGNDLIEKPAFRFSFVTVSLGVDAEGKETTAPVLRWLEDDEAFFLPAHGTKRRPVKGAKAVALKLLRKAIDEAGSVPPASNHIPPNTRTIPVETWRTFAYQGSISESDKPDSKQKAFVRAAKELQAANLIGIWGGYAWIA